jgi:hypothetical protein
VQRWSTPASCGTPRRRLPARSRRDVGGPQAGSRPAGPETQRGRGQRGRGQRGRGAAGTGGGGDGGQRDRGRRDRGWSDPAPVSGGGTRRDPAGQGSPGSRRHRPPGARGPAPLPPSSSLAAPAGPAVPAVADLPLDGPHLARRRPGDRRAAGAEGGWPSLGQAPEAGRDGAPGGVLRPTPGGSSVRGPRAGGCPLLRSVRPRGAEGTGRWRSRTLRRPADVCPQPRVVGPGAPD